MKQSVKSVHEWLANGGGAYAGQKFDTLNGEQQSNVIAEMTTHNSQVAAEAVKAQMQSEMTEKEKAFEAQLKSLKEDSAKLEAAFDARLAEISAMKNDSAKIKSLGELAMEVKAEGKTILEALKAKSKDFAVEIPMSLKAAANMGNGTNITGTGYLPQPFLTEFDGAVRRALSLINDVSMVTIASNTFQIPSYANPDGAPAGRAELTLAAQIDFDINNTLRALKTRSASVTVSEEMLDDVSFIQNEINGDLIDRMLRDVESQIYNGDGTGQNLNGLVGFAPAFAAGAFALSVVLPNVLDVLTVAMNQIALAEQPTPTHIYMHPSDFTTLKLIKASATDGQYVARLSEVIQSRSYDGAAIRTSTLVPVGTFLMFNSAYTTVYQKGGLAVETGLVDDNFTRFARTIRGNWRGQVGVKPNKFTSMVTGTFSTAITAITKP